MSAISLSGRSSAAQRYRSRPFSSHCEPDGVGSVQLRLSGELDLASEEEFEAALRSAENSGHVVIVDLAELEFIDCSSLARLAETASRMKRAGKKLVLVGGSGQVDRLLALVGEPRDAERRRRDPRHELVVGGVGGAVAAGLREARMLAEDRPDREVSGDGRGRMPAALASARASELVRSYARRLGERERRMPSSTRLTRPIERLSTDD